MLSNLKTHYGSAANPLAVFFKCHNVFLKPSVNENHSCLINANPLFSLLLVISFSSIKLTVLVTHDGAHYHDNVGNDGRAKREELRGVYVVKSVQLSHED